MNTDPTATEVERYEAVRINYTDGDKGFGLVPSPTGDWVRYEDYEKLKRELATMHELHTHLLNCLSL